MRCVDVVITGRVQAVGFRWNCHRAAVEAGVQGWVRNVLDGTVEARFFGEDSAVQSMIDWCRNGPAHARIEDVVVTDLENPGPISGFEIH
ncbi:acylphosphatase [Flaviflexus sp.]|uniref:acylphosphatase n=1 Tax=Flaviflexus sp. TaxID=1969482 RepID=UPI003F90757A